MIVYLGSPDSRQLCEAVRGMPVLLSFALAGKKKFVVSEYVPTFQRLLIDSGAFSELNSGVKVDGEAYRDWHAPFQGHADAVAGLDDISGDWQRSLRNYEQYGGFPTMHDTDPPELLKELISLARERGRWLGIGLKPPRNGKESFIRRVCDSVPDDLHIHGWALGTYTHIRRLNSIDSTSWFRKAFDLRNHPLTSHLTYGECLEIVVKRYVRWQRVIVDPQAEPNLFSELEAQEASCE